MPDDTELGIWLFSTKLVGNQDWQEIVPLGPLGNRIGSDTRRQLVLSSFCSAQVKRTWDTGMFETVLAAYKHMSKTHKPDFGNSTLLFADGKGNHDPGGPALKETLARLKCMVDPTKPVQVIMELFPSSASVMVEGEDGLDGRCEAGW